MSLRIEGEVEAPQTFSFDDLRGWPLLDVASLLPGKAGSGVRLDALLAAARPRASARWATLASADGTFAVSVPLDDVRTNAVVACALDGAALPPGKGGPFRFYVLDAAACRSGAVDACANVKGLGLIRLTATREPDVGHDHGARSHAP